MSQPSCRAVTKRGTACRAFAPPGRIYCVTHDPELVDKVAAARIRGGTAADRLRVLQGKRAKLDSASAVVKFTSGVIQGCLAGTIEVEIARTTLYGLSVQLKAIELAEAATARHLVEEVKQLAR